MNKKHVDYIGFFFDDLYIFFCDFIISKGNSINIHVRHSNFIVSQPKTDKLLQ